MPSSKFKPSEFKINNDTFSSGQVKIVDLDVTGTPVIKSFEMEAVKAKAPSQFHTDSGQMGRNQKNSRFSLNPLLREPLSIKQEEERAIEQKVEVRLSALVEQAKAAAIQEGYKEGYQKGLDEAFNKIREENAGNIQKFDQLMEQAENAKTEIFRANERFLIGMIFQIAKMVLLKELTADKEYLLRLAKEVLGKIGVRDHIKLQISSKDAETIGLLKEGLETALGKMSNLSVEVSPNVKQGGLLVETEWNAIDASVETQLAQIHESLLSKGGSSGP